MALTPAQLKERAPRIGGSDAAAICGKDPYKDAYQVAMRILGRLEGDPDLENADQILFGNEMEGVLGRIYEHKFKVKLETPAALVHPKEPQIAVNIDRRIVGNPEVALEMKNTGRFVQSNDPLQQWGKVETSEVPQRVALQCFHAMMVDPQIKLFHVLRCYGGNQFQKFALPRDDDVVDALFEIETKFLARLRAGKIPEPDWYMSSTEDAIKRMNKAIEGTVEARPELVHWTECYAEAAAARLEASKLEDAIKNRVLHMMETTGVAILPDGRKWVRKKVHRDSYQVEACDYVDCRLVKPRKKAAEADDGGA
jgi:predicted phage-related endonuclease